MPTLDNITARVYALGDELDRASEEADEMIERMEGLAGSGLTYYARRPEFASVNGRPIYPPWFFTGDFSPDLMPGNPNQSQPGVYLGGND